MYSLEHLIKDLFRVPHFGWVLLAWLAGFKTKTKYVLINSMKERPTSACRIFYTPETYGIILY